MITSVYTCRDKVKINKGEQGREIQITQRNSFVVTVVNLVSLIMCIYMYGHKFPPV